MTETKPTAPEGYSQKQVALHWNVAGLVAVQFLFNDAIGHAWHDWHRTGAALSYGPLVLLHITGGLLIALFAAYRIFLRRAHGVPAPHEAEAPALRLAAHLAHLSLYALLLGLVATGVLAWFGKSGAMGDLHELLTNLLIALIAAHIGAVAWHRYRGRDILSRMLTPVD